MKTQTLVTITDTNIIPDRNAGIVSLLWDLQHPQNFELDGQALLDRSFAFIDVGVSRARVSVALKLLLARDLKMNVDYVATERPDAVSYANVTPLGDWKAQITRCLSTMISSGETTREVTDWYYVVDDNGKVSSIAYSYNYYGNEVCEAYYMGRPFMVSGERIEFNYSILDEMLVSDVKQIEAKIDLEMKRDSDSSQPAPSWDGYKIKKNPLEIELVAYGITLQKTDVPQRAKDRQNVLFLGNVINHFPKKEQASELERIASNMQEGDIIIVQVDDLEAAFIEVLSVNGKGALKTHERVRWINTRSFEIQMAISGSVSWQQIHLKPELERISKFLMNCLERKSISFMWNQKNQKVFIHQSINYVFGTFFRALPVEETLRIAIREALRRLPSGGGMTGIPVFRDDAKDAYGGALGSNPSPIVSEADLNDMMMAPANVTR